MAALAAERPTTQVIETKIGLPVKASAVIYKGAFVVSDAGYAAPGSTATGKLAMGRANQTVDNTGAANGAKYVEVERGAFWFANSGTDAVDANDVGKVCYIEDDQTVAETSGTNTRSPAGQVLAVDSSRGVLVHVGTVDGTALAAEIVSREAITTDLASVANAKGASLVGVEDSAELYTGATVEACLAEKLTGLRVANVADVNVIGGLEVLHRIDVADGVTGDIDTVLTHKTMVLDAQVIKKAGAGGAGDTITVKNVATAITDAMSINVADKAVVRAAEIDDAAQTVAAGAILRITRTKAAAANVACLVIVRGIRVA